MFSTRAFDFKTYQKTLYVRALVRLSSDKNKLHLQFVKERNIHKIRTTLQLLTEKLNHLQFLFEKIENYQIRIQYIYYLKLKKNYQIHQ